MGKREENYRKLIRVIKSCKNSDHLKTAVKAANYFMKMYEVGETDKQYQTAKTLVGLMKIKCKVGHSEDHIMEEDNFLTNKTDWTNAAANAGLKGVFFEDEIVGGVADDKTPKDLAKKHRRTLRDIADEINIGKEVEGEHTKSKKKAKEIAMDHVSEFPEYYSHEEHGVLASEKAMEDELEESTTAGSSGAFTGLFNGGGKKPIKRTIHKSDIPVTVNGLTRPIGNMYTYRNESKIFKKEQLKEANVTTKKEMLESTDGGSFTPYDSPAGWGNNEFMGTKGKKGNAVQKKGAVPKTWDYDTGSSTYVKVKEKCKKFPYCVQDSNAIETSDTPFKVDEGNEKLIESICKKTGKSKKYVHSLINRYL